ncbi:3-keto-5-aminohexanoate cleavage protein [Nonomuraea sp. NPDC052129]|uniref:3-keto-5-aminohexanoate cleavage protein n=1 Tax=Nonomuraea sp. NPDC052129 TaxID=3154651 RepID=UPI00341EE9FA
MGIGRALTLAPTGGIHTPSRPPHLPFPPTRSLPVSIEAAEAGTAIIHAYDPEAGRPDHNRSCS